MDDKQAFYVESTDGRKFKMVIRGDLGKLSVAKIRRYLKSYGVPDHQQILAGSLVLEDDMLGEHFGLYNEGVLYLREPLHDAPPAAHVPSDAVPSPLSSTVGSLKNTQGSALAASTRPAPSTPAAESYNSPPPQTQAHQQSQQQQQQVRDLEDQLNAANARNAELERLLQQARRSPVAATASHHTPTSDGLMQAKESLARLGEKLRVSLQLDGNLTCVVGTDADFSILLTYDPATERLYLYSTVLTELPQDPEVRMKLYEVLLEGSLLGREVCGGGIGISTKNNVVVLTTSVPVRHCSPEALCDVMPAFVETLSRWRDLVALLAD